MTVEPGSAAWFIYTGRPQDYPVWHDYHYRQAVTDPAILRHMNVSPAYGGGEGMSAQLEAKAKFLSSPTAQWESQRAYERAYRDYISSGGIPSKVKPAGVIPQSTMAERRAEAAMIERQQATKEALRLDAMRAGAVLPFREAASQAAKEGEVYAPRFGKMISREEFYAKRPTPFMKAGAAYEKAERQVSKTLNLEGVFGNLEASYQADQAQYKQLFGKVAQGKTIKPLPKWFTGSEKVYGEFLTGAKEGIIEKPLSSAVNMASMFTLVRGSGYAVSKMPWLAKGITAGRIGKKVSLVNIGGAALGSVYVADVAGRTLTSESPAREVGRIAATELVPMAIGGYLGTLKLPGGKGGKLYEIEELTGFEVAGKAKVKGGKIDISSMTQRVKPITKRSYQTFSSEPGTIKLENVPFPVEFSTQNRIGLVKAEYAGEGVFSFKKGQTVFGDFGGVKRLPEQSPSIAYMPKYPKIGKVSKVVSADRFALEVSKLTKTRGFTPTRKLYGVDEFTGVIESKTTASIKKAPGEVVEMRRYVAPKQLGTGRKQLTTKTSTEIIGKARVGVTNLNVEVGKFIKEVRTSSANLRNSKLRIPTQREYELSKLKQPGIVSKTVQKLKTSAAGIKSPIKKTEFEYNKTLGVWVKKQGGTFDKAKADFVRFVKDDRARLLALQRELQTPVQKRKLEVMERPRVLPSLQNLRVAATEIKTSQPVASASFVSSVSTSFAALNRAEALFYKATPEARTGGKTGYARTTGSRPAGTTYRQAITPPKQDRKINAGLQNHIKNIERIEPLFSTGIITSPAQGITPKLTQPTRTPVRIRTPDRYPEQREKPLLMPKRFLSQIDKYKREKGKRKHAWDVRNPVPDLKSLFGDNEERYRKKRKR